MNRPQRFQRGFTLIELLIVLGIISVLAWALLPMVVEATGSGNEAQTKARIQHLRMCIERYADKHGYYPPSAFARADKSVKVKNNSENEGIECLLVHIHKERLGRAATLEDKLDWLSNCDGDDGGFYIDRLDTSELHEVIDGFKTPIVYFREDTYGRKQVVVAGEQGDQLEAAAWRHPVTNQYLNKSKYQLISAGKDGEFNTDDDITYPPRPVTDSD